MDKLKVHSDNRHQAFLATKAQEEEEDYSETSQRPSEALEALARQQVADLEIWEILSSKQHLRHLSLAIKAVLVSHQVLAGAEVYSVLNPLPLGSKIKQHQDSQLLGQEPMLLLIKVQVGLVLFLRLLQAQDSAEVRLEPRAHQ